MTWSITHLCTDSHLRVEMAPRGYAFQETMEGQGQEGGGGNGVLQGGCALTRKSLGPRKGS